MSQEIGLLSILIASLMDENFYGELLIKFEAGHIVLIKKTQNIKLSEDMKPKK